MSVVTNRVVLEKHEINTNGIEHLDLEVRVLTGMQRQGDVLIVPCAPPAGVFKPIPVEGVTVVRGETSGGNAHILHALDGECAWAESQHADRDLLQGWLTVAPGASATLIHTQEHNVIGIGPGCYEIRRQREFAGEWRRVSD